MKKSPLLSKTLWVAAFDFALVVVSHYAADPATAEQVKHASGVLLPVVMFLLRLITREPVI